MASRLVEVKNETLMPVIETLLKAHQSVKLTITGNSMYPFLRHGVDCIQLIPIEYSYVHKNDVVLIKRADGAYVLHRVIRRQDHCFYIVGDAQDLIEGPIMKEQLIAGVEGIWRKHYYIPSDNRIYRLLVSIWMILRPIRVKIIRTKARTQRWVSKLKHIKPLSIKSIKKRER